MITRDYDGLVAAVAGWMHKPGLVGSIPSFVMLAESRIYRKLRVRGMEASLEVTVQNGAAPLPDRYVELKHIRVDGQRPLERKSPEWIYAQYPSGAAAGTPQYVARDGNTLIFGPAPADGLVLKGMYYARPLPLAEDAPTNWFTENAIDLLMFAALCEAAPYMVNDARIPVWEAKFAALLDDLQQEDDSEASSGPALSLSIR